MDRASWFVLALVEDDEYWLWEVEGALRVELGLEGLDIRAQTGQVIQYLLDARLIKLSGASGALSPPAVQAELATAHAWLPGPQALRVSTTHSGRARYRQGKAERR